MNYRNNYLEIIKHAKNQNRKKNMGTYYENHHILPKSLYPNWKNKKSNKVLLTAREHFLCHYLLCKIYSYNKNSYYKMLNAFQRMSENNEYTKGLLYMNSILYENLKIKYYELKKQKHWYTNDLEEGLLFECPTGWKPGRVYNENYGINMKEPSFIEKSIASSHAKKGTKKALEAGRKCADTRRLRNSFAKGYKWSEEAKERQKGKKRDKGAWNRLKIICDQTETIFNSKNEAEVFYGYKKRIILDKLYTKGKLKGLSFRKI